MTLDGNQWAPPRMDSFFNSYVLKCKPIKIGTEHSIPAESETQTKTKINSLRALTLRKHRETFTMHLNRQESMHGS